MRSVLLAVAAPHAAPFTPIAEAEPLETVTVSLLIVIVTTGAANAHENAEAFPASVRKRPATPATVATSHAVRRPFRVLVLLMLSPLPNASSTLLSQRRRRSVEDPTSPHGRAQRQATGDAATQPAFCGPFRPGAAVSCVPAEALTDASVTSGRRARGLRGACSARGAGEGRGGSRAREAEGGHNRVHLLW